MGLGSIVMSAASKGRTRKSGRRARSIVTRRGSVSRLRISPRAFFWQNGPDAGASRPGLLGGGLTREGRVSRGQERPSTNAENGRQGGAADETARDQRGGGTDL